MDQLNVTISFHHPYLPPGSCTLVVDFGRWAYAHATPEDLKALEARVASYNIQIPSSISGNPPNPQIQKELLNIEVSSGANTFPATSYANLPLPALALLLPRDPYLKDCSKAMIYFRLESCKATEQPLYNYLKPIDNYIKFFQEPIKSSVQRLGSYASTTQVMEADVRIEKLLAERYQGRLELQRVRIQLDHTWNELVDVLYIERWARFF
jgi:hypothetical protein